LSKRAKKFQHFRYYIAKGTNESGFPSFPECLRHWLAERMKLQKVQRIQQNNAIFAPKRRLIEMFDVHGKLIVENNQIIEVTCLLALPLPSPIQILHSLNTGVIAIRICDSPKTVPSR
jgi:hypothetical protein